MTPSADLSPPRRPIFFPVVIATVFLTIIGMAAGYVLGERQRPRGGDQPSQSQGQGQTTAVTSQSTAAPAPSGPACPPEASQKAVEAGRSSRLTQVRKFVTDNGSTAWICADPTGALYYQSKTGGVNSKLVQGKNGLFLPDVRQTGDDQYEAIAVNGNRIEVSRTHLQIYFSDGTVQSNHVESVQ